MRRFVGMQSQPLSVAPRGRHCRESGNDGTSGDVVKVTYGKFCTFFIIDGIMFWLR